MTSHLMFSASCTNLIHLAWFAVIVNYHKYQLTVRRCSTAFRKKRCALSEFLTNYEFTTTYRRPNSSRNSKFPLGESATKYVKVFLKANKATAKILCDKRDIIHIGYLQEERTNNGENDGSLLNRFNYNLDKKNTKTIQDCTRA